MPIEKLPLTILYVEDDEAIRGQTAKILGRFATKVIVADNGESGFNEFRNHHIDIVVCDIKMPIMSGLEMAKLIRAENKTIPIIVMTAHSDLENLMESIEVGVNDFLIKPIARDKLEDRLNKYSREIELALRLKNQALRFQSMLDFQSNMLILTNGIEVLEANKSFTDFLGQDLMQKLNKGILQLDDIFVTHDGFIQKLQNRNWLDAYFANEFQYSAVKILDQSNEEYTFMVKASKFDYEDGYFIVSFADATDYEENRKNLEILANTDALTKIPNRLRFTNALDSELERSKKSYTIFSIAMFDIDHFKKINDFFGHDVGDEVIIKISEIVKNNIRSTDLLARWGGEEFMILFANINKDIAYTLCERLRSLICGDDFINSKNATCSFGVTEYIIEEDKATLLKRVDDALYEAKNSGRNCCKVR